MFKAAGEVFTTPLYEMYDSSLEAGSGTLHPSLFSPGSQTELVPPPPPAAVPSPYLQRKRCRLVSDVSPDNVTLDGQHATLHDRRLRRLRLRTHGTDAQAATARRRARTEVQDNSACDEQVQRLKDGSGAADICCFSSGSCEDTYTAAFKGSR